MRANLDQFSQPNRARKGEGRRGENVSLNESNPFRPIELEGKQERKGEGIRNYQKPLPYSPRAHTKFVT